MPDPALLGAALREDRAADLIDDPAYRDQAARHQSRPLTVVLDEALSARTTAEWLEVLGGAVPCAPVYDVRQALENPFLAEREGVQVLDHPDRPGFKLLASPIRMGAEVPARPRPSSARTPTCCSKSSATARPRSSVARAGRDLNATLAGIAWRHRPQLHGTTQQRERLGARVTPSSPGL